MKLTQKEILAELIAEYGSVEEAMESDALEGICHNCGYIQEGVEPDARNYTCDECGADAVCGIEETLITMI